MAVPPGAKRSDVARSIASFGGDPVGDVHIAHLRAELGAAPAQPRLAKTVRGVGYHLKAGSA